MRCFFAAALMMFCATTVWADYSQIIGIPDPDTSFAADYDPLDTTYRFYDTPDNRNDSLTYHQNSEGGYYTHYVDGTDIDCLDQQAFGNPSSPRCTIPTSIPEGAVVEVHGGFTVNTTTTHLSSGTSDRPAFIRGHDAENQTVITGNYNGSGDQMRLEGTHLIVENFEFDSWKVVVIGEHITVRHSYLHGRSGNGEYECDRLDLNGSYNVAYNNEIAYMRRYNDGWVDCHGVQAGCGSDHIWVLDNDIHHNSGDSFQSGNKCSGNEPSHIYVGRNRAHDNVENALDCKYVKDIIFSQNICYNINNSDNSDGTAILIGSDGYPSNAWVLFNHVYDSDLGIRVEDATSGALIGNLIHDIQGHGIRIDKEAGGHTAATYGIHANTIHNAGLVNGSGIDGFQQPNARLEITGNIIDNETPIRLSSLLDDDPDSDSLSADNVYFNGGSTMTLQWDGSTTSDVSETADLAGTDFSDDVVGDPRFANPSSGVYSLQESSAAIGIVAKHQHYTDFYNRYGLSIAYGFAGNARGAEPWDAGALVYAAGSGSEDSEPPFISGQNPPPGQTEVAIDTTISATLSDSGDGVDIATIEMHESGNKHCCSGQSCLSGIADLACTGTPASFSVTYAPGANEYSYSQVVDVTWDASDLTMPPNQMSQNRHEFTCENDPDQNQGGSSGSGGGSGGGCFLNDFIITD